MKPGGTQLLVNYFVFKSFFISGYLVYGGVFEETWCSFGGRKFTCLYITKEIMLDALAQAGLFVEEGRQCVLYEINGMFLVCARKRQE